MDSYQRISALNSSNIANNLASGVQATNSIIDFEVSAGDVYDLSKCYISLPFRVIESSGDVCGFIITDTEGNTLNPVRLIKNINVKSDRLGVLEDIKEVGVLRNTLNNYSLKADKDSRTDSVFGSFDSFGNVNSPFRLLRREGNEASEELTVECQIYLKDLLNLANQDAYSTAKYGALHISIELNTRGMAVKQVQGTTDNASRVLKKTTYIDQSSVNGARGTFDDPGAQADLTLFNLTTATAYNNLKFSPFHVGQALTVIKGAGTGDVRSPNTISSIAQSADGKLVLTFTGSILTSTGTPTGMSASVPDKSANYSIDAPELVMSKTNNTPPDMFEFLSYHTEIDTSASGLSINKVYQVSPNATNVLVLAPLDDKGRSDFNALVDYRFRVDNQEVTDRNVGKATSLHYGLLHDVFKNMGMEFVDSDEKLYQLKDVEQEGDAGVVNEMIACKVEENGQPSLVDIEINSSTTGPVQLNIYSSVVKQF